MLQLSYDGRRLYVSNSLYSTWDNQFYPGMRSWLLRIDCDPNGGMEIDRDFFVDFSRPPGRPRARARGAAAERRLHHGDLPVMLAHVMGIPVEESVLQLVPAGVRRGAWRRPLWISRWRNEPSAQRLRLPATCNPRHTREARDEFRPDRS